jgi:hypothetical protein
MSPKRPVVALTQTRPRGEPAAVRGLLGRTPVVHRFDSGALSRPQVASARDARLAQFISFGFLAFCLASPLVRSFTVHCTSSGAVRNIDSCSVGGSTWFVSRCPDSETRHAARGVRRSDGERYQSVPADQRKQLLPLPLLDCIRRRIAMTSFVCCRRMLSAAAYIACRPTATV